MGQRIKYYDFLKFLAILSIIVLHSCWGAKPLFFGHKLSFYTNMIHFGVPLFLMISGALLLNRDIEIISFLKKKTVRLIYPLALYVILSTFVFSLYPNVITGYWYAFMMVGIYLAIPIVNIFIKNAEMKEIEYFLILFIAVSVFYQIIFTFKVKTNLDLNFFIGPFSYLILGYYLSRKDLTNALNLSPNKIVILSILIFIISSVVKMYMGSCEDIYPKLELMNQKLDLSIIQVVQATSIFIMCKYIYGNVTGILGKCRSLLEGERVNHFVMSISRASYGIYLFHWFIIKLSRGYGLLPFKILTKKILIADLALALVLFFASWLVVLVINRIPVLKYLSGYA